MEAAAWAAHDPGVLELLIRFERPASLSESDMRSWLSQRARAGRPELTLSRRDRTGQDELIRVTVPSDSTGAVEDQIADLMMDMRLLGLRPTVLSHPQGNGPAALRQDG